MKKTALTYASRQEVDVELICFEGEVPDDLSGFVFINSPVGTVNYETPIPKYNPDGSDNPEYGQMIFNGDGMILRFDCDTPKNIRLKTGLMRTPCFYADLNSKMGTQYYEDGFYFKSCGISRMNTRLGTRNQINTSINSFKFGENKSPRLTANFDAGRPFEFDPVSLELITPIGYSHEWRSEFADRSNEVFQMNQSTAHPSFDPITQEFFTVCFQKSAADLVFTEKIEEFLDNFLENLKETWDDFLQFLGLQAEAPDMSKYSKEKIKAIIAKNNDDEKDLFGMENGVRLMRWKGEKDLETWNVVDEEGKNIIINQTMHQTSLSKDYIILVDTSLKFALDVIEDRFGTSDPTLNKILRALLFKKIEPNTPLYLIRRADLVPENDNVIARKIEIDIETVHFSVEYQNPDDIITMHAAHNSALCAAEWVREYDTLAINDEPIDENTIGLMICGQMDISRVGRWKIDGKTAQIVGAKKVYSKGFEGNNVRNLTQPHTWAVGLCTFRHIISSRNTADTIPYIFWQFYGLDYRMLTTFVKEKYSDYEHRIIPVDDLLEYNREGVPFCLSRQNTETMEFEDWYYFKMNQNLRSLQYVRRKRENPFPDIKKDALDGYILCTMINGNEDFSGDEYSREVWIFDAANLKNGPVCKLHHPEMQYAFTIHSAWIESCQPSPRDYNVDIIADYLEILDTFTDTGKKNEISQFLKDTVFPYYPNV